MLDDALLCPVQRPIIVQKGNLYGAIGNFVRDSRRCSQGIGVKRDKFCQCINPPPATLEVLPVPLEVGRKLEPSFPIPIAGAVGQKAAGLVLQLTAQSLAHISLRAQCRATDSGALERKMDARFVEAARFPDNFFSLMGTPSKVATCDTA